MNEQPRRNVSWPVDPAIAPLNPSTRTKGFVYVPEARYVPVPHYVLDRPRTTRLGDAVRVVLLSVAVLVVAVTAFSLVDYIVLR